MRHQFLVIAAVCAMFVGCAAELERPAPASEPETPAPTSEVIPDMIVADRGGIAPEGVEYDTTNNRFLMGSASEGSIFQIHNDGRVTTVVSDPDLVGSMGIEVDELRDRLLVVGWGQAKLGVYNLTTGELLAELNLSKRGYGCGTLSASSKALFFRSGNPASYQLDSHTIEPITKVSRPGCWINMIPASGMLLIPEGSSGCTCNYAVQGSMAFVPR